MRADRGAAALLVLLCGAARVSSQPVSLSPAMGWRSWYGAPAHGLVDPTQAFVMASMDAMADRSRMPVHGSPEPALRLGLCSAHT